MQCASTCVLKKKADRSGHLDRSGRMPDLEDFFLMSGTVESSSRGTQIVMQLFLTLLPFNRTLLLLTVNIQVRANIKSWLLIDNALGNRIER
jgi:hypothetical protein